MGWITPRLLAVQDARFKLVIDFHRRTDTLYDLARDPEETVPLPSDVQPEAGRKLFRAIAAHFSTAHARALEPRRPRAVAFAAGGRKSA